MSMPILFVGHGNPMNAIEDNLITKKWRIIAESIPKPKAICCISAHWLSTGLTAITAMEKPRTIHDFYGFPGELFEIQYPAPGSLDLVNEIQNNVHLVQIQSDLQWGFDHGTWSVLKHMYPQGDIPTVQLSIDFKNKLNYHFELGKALQFLRDKEVLLIGSGNIVHNLRMMTMDDTAFPWAIDFDFTVADLIKNKNYDKLINYDQINNYQLALPSNEHYLPLLYILGASRDSDQIEWFNDTVMNGSISMRSLILRS